MPAPRLGTQPIQALGKNPGPGDLISSGVGGAVMADVSVDIETGIVKMNKMVCVQDCGLVISMKTAESQVYGAMIMGIASTLYEEKIMDPNTGHMLNPNMDFYRLAGIGDIGELVVHMMTGKGYDERGPIGLGEPPTVGPMAAIGNAVANAIGVRVPFLPITPDRVVARSLERRQQCDRLITPAPTTTDQVPALLGKSWGEVEILAGGSDLLSLMKDEITTPKRLVNIKSIQALHAISNEARRC